MSKDPKNQPEVSGNDTAAANDPHILEEIFPETDTLFKPHPLPPISNSDVGVALDASAMLLPYRVNSVSVHALGKVYERLARENRLFIPARAAREFAKNRNKELGDLIQTLKQRKEAFAKLPPLLAGMSGYDDAMDATAAARTAYSKLEAQIKAWRGDDPVSKLYARIVKKSTIVDLPLDKKAQAQLLQEMSHRYSNQVPPGYKDASKGDGGIGDLIIWKTLLRIGHEKKINLVFLTGEQKPDWFNRASGEHVYLRYELIDEYRRASDGKTIELMSLHQLLEQMEASAEVIKDVRAAEQEAQSAALASSNASVSIPPGFKIIRRPEGTFLVPPQQAGTSPTLYGSSISTITPNISSFTVGPTGVGGPGSVYFGPPGPTGPGPVYFGPTGPAGPTGPVYFGPTGSRADTRSATGDSTSTDTEDNPDGNEQK